MAAAGTFYSLLPVSYTHLDVYKRQVLGRCLRQAARMAAALLPGPAGSESQGRRIAALLYAQIGFCHSDTVCCHQYGVILLYGYFYQRVQCGIVEVFPPLVVYR